MSKILVVEDDEHLLFIIGKTLENVGYRVLLADSGKTAINILNENPDTGLVIADLIMPDVDGIQLCNYIRGNKELEHIPIMIITGQADLFHKCQGFGAGADDFITKPVEFVEFLLRVKALLKRNMKLNYVSNNDSEQHHNEKIIYHSDKTEIEVTTKNGFKILLNKNNSTINVNNKIEYLTSTEFNILELLIYKKNEPVDTNEILEKILNYPPGDGNPVSARTHIRNIRSKIEKDPNNPEIIINIPKRGYILNIDFEHL